MKHIERIESAIATHAAASVSSLLISTRGRALLFLLCVADAFDEFDSLFYSVVIVSKAA